MNARVQIELPSREADARVTATYLIQSGHCSQILIRLLGLFAQNDLEPLHVSARRSSGGLAVRVRQRGLAEHRAHVIAEKMRSMVAVRSVELRCQG